jgi:pyruvate/2-oxoglutarate dehydrogenase complex dihydrolipoamide acyltransferase (E2) component
MEELESRCDTHLIACDRPTEMEKRSPQIDAVTAVAVPTVSGGSQYSATRFSKHAAQLLATHNLSAADFPDAGLMTASRLRRSLALHDPGEDVSHPVEVAANGAAVAAHATLPRLRSERISLAKHAEVEALRAGESGNVNSMLSVRFDSAAIRRRLREERLFDGSIQPLALYEISRLLKGWPQFTAFYQRDEIHYYDRIDLGLAMDLGKGLKVVTLRAADQLTLGEIFERVLDMGTRYLENRLRPEELAGSTLTVTDLSGLDILQFHPLVNGRQAAIIGLGGDKTLAGYPMSINMTFDHRVSNGREVAIFLNELRSRLLSYEAAHAIEVASHAVAATESRKGEAMPAACDRCGLGVAAYYAGFGQDGYMLAYYKEDGSLGSVCHRCYDRWS